MYVINNGLTFSNVLGQMLSDVPWQSFGHSWCRDFEDAPLRLPDLETIQSGHGHDGVPKAFSAILTIRGKS
jgi:hypothetical protein